MEHLLWECKETLQGKTPQFEWLKKERDKEPQHKCLWNTGNVGKGFVQCPQSKQMQEEEQMDRPTTLTQTHVITVFTDGGRVKGAGGTRAGYGIYWGEQDQRNESRALRGKPQTAQRAEVSALWRMLDRTTQKVEIMSDSKYTVDTANRILQNPGENTEAKTKTSGIKSGT